MISSKCLSSNLRDSKCDFNKRPKSSFALNFFRSSYLGELFGNNNVRHWSSHQGTARVKSQIATVRISHSRLSTLPTSNFQLPVLRACSSRLFATCRPSPWQKLPRSRNGSKNFFKDCLRAKLFSLMANYISPVSHHLKMFSNNSSYRLVDNNVLFRPGRQALARDDGVRNLPYHCSNVIVDSPMWNRLQYTPIHNFMLDRGLYHQRLR